MGSSTTTTAGTLASTTRRNFRHNQKMDASEQLIESSDTAAALAAAAGQAGEPLENSSSKICNQEEYNKIFRPAKEIARRKFSTKKNFFKMNQLIKLFWNFFSSIKLGFGEHKTHAHAEEKVRDGADRGGQVLLCRHQNQHSALALSTAVGQPESTTTARTTSAFKLSTAAYIVFSAEHANSHFHPTAAAQYKPRLLEYEYLGEPCHKRTAFGG
jgi:hypothetical protein